MNFFKLTTIVILLLPIIVFSANDFVADSDIVVSEVTFGVTTADITILSNSTADSVAFDGGVFTVTNPNTFKVSSSDSRVKSIQTIKNGRTIVCSENLTPGISHVALPVDSGVYTIRLSATTDCTDLCTVLDNVSSYNSFPTCGASSCTSGFRISGYGEDATCVLIGGGGIFSGTLPTPKEFIPREQTIYPDGTVIYHDEEVEKLNKEEQFINNKRYPLFVKKMLRGEQNNDIKRLQKLLATDSSIYPEGMVTGYFGFLTEGAVQRFQTKYDIVSSGTPQTTGYGLVGPKTIKKLNEVFGSTEFVSPTISNPVSINISSVFAQGLFRGMNNQDTTNLQQLLRELNIFTYPTNTGYYGTVTETAVKQFQCNYNIICEGTPQTTGYGVVGPKTRAKLNEVQAQTNTN